MAISMKERYERAKEHQKNVSERRVDKRNKVSLPSYKGKTEDKFEKIWKQLGLCAICEKDIREGSKLVHIDHDHETGAIRGILCHNCNVGLGHFKDSIKLLQAAIDYLNDYRTEDFKLKDVLQKYTTNVHPSWTTPLEVKPFDPPKNWWDGLPDLIDFSVLKS